MDNNQENIINDSDGQNERGVLDIINEENPEEEEEEEHKNNMDDAAALLLNLGNILMGAPNNPPNMRSPEWIQQYANILTNQLRPATVVLTEEDLAVIQICSSHIIPVINEIRQTMGDDYKDEFRYDSTTNQTGNMIGKYWDERGTLPGVDEFDDLILYMCEYKYANEPCACMNLDEYMNNDQGKQDLCEVIKRYFVDTGGYPDCVYMNHMLLYKLDKDVFPSQTEYAEYVRHVEEINQDPEQYYQDHKHQLPTKNVDLLKPKKYENTEATTCGICYNDINQGDFIVELPCGGNHIFHSDESQCLEGLTIIDWMKNNKQCPLCKGEIVIKDS